MRWPWSQCQLPLPAGKLGGTWRAVRLPRALPLSGVLAGRGGRGRARSLGPRHPSEPLAEEDHDGKVQQFAPIREAETVTGETGRTMHAACPEDLRFHPYWPDARPDLDRDTRAGGEPSWKLNRNPTPTHVRCASAPRERAAAGQARTPDRKTDHEAGVSSGDPSGRRGSNGRLRCRSN